MTAISQKRNGKAREAPQLAQCHTASSRPSRNLPLSLPSPTAARLRLQGTALVLGRCDALVLF